MIDKRFTLLVSANALIWMILYLRNTPTPCPTFPTPIPCPKCLTPTCPSPTPCPTCPKVKTENRYVSYSLYGNEPKYINGAIRNAELVPTVYPGWKMRFYIYEDVVSDVIIKLKDLGAEIVIMRKIDYESWFPSAGGFWRYFIIDDPMVDRVIFRDVDSRLGLRELAAVNEWITSGKYFHTMRDHKAHYEPLMGGMWGMVNRAKDDLNIGNVTELIYKFISQRNDRNKGIDQNFLSQEIWKFAKDNCIQHDTFGCNEYPESIAFPTKRVLSAENVGAWWSENDRPLVDDLGESPPECRRKPEWIYG